MASKSTQTVTAATVRAFLTADPKRMERLPVAARKSVTGTTDKGPRGRLHPAAIKAYNKGRKADRQYVEGAGKAVKAEAVALRAEAVALGAKSRGPLPKAVREALSQPKG